jgi:hypothetical protein
MARPDLLVRAEALRAEAASVRPQAIDAYFKRRTELELEQSRVTTAQDAAEHAALRAADQAKAAADQALRDGIDGFSLGYEARGRARQGDHGEAEETAEIAEYRNRSAQVAHERERQAALDAAKFREESAGHERRLTELEFDVKANNQANGLAEQHLDRLEEQARLYELAARKFALAEATDNIPARAQLELEAEAAVRGAEELRVDRAAIRVFVPDLPEVTPGLPATAAAEMGDDPTSAGAVASADDDLGVGLAATPSDADDRFDGDAEVTSGDDTFSVEAPAADDLASIETPAVAMETFEPEAEDSAFAMADAFGFDAPAEVAADSFESTGDMFDA